MSYEALAKELRRRIKEAKEHSDKIGAQDSEFERLAKLSRKELMAELRDLRKELTPLALSKMAKHELVNEIIKIKHMIEADVHVPHQAEEVVDASRKAPKKAVQKRAEMTASKVTEAHSKMPAPAAAPAKKRKGSPLLARVAAKRREGMSLKDAWAAVKAEKA